MAATIDLYADIAAMKAVTPATDGTIAMVWFGGKGTLYVYRTAAVVGAANAGWYKPTAR